MDAKRIGSYIASARKAKGLTQKQLADQLGVTSKTISRWETGSHMPDVSMLLPICEALDITANALLEEDVIEDAKTVKVKSSYFNMKRISLCTILILMAFIYIQYTNAPQKSGEPVYITSVKEYYDEQTNTTTIVESEKERVEYHTVAIEI